MANSAKPTCWTRCTTTVKGLKLTVLVRWRHYAHVLALELCSNSFYLASMTVFQRRSDCSPGDCITQQHSFLSHLVRIFFSSDCLSTWGLSVISFKLLCSWSFLHRNPSFNNPKGFIKILNDSTRPMTDAGCKDRTCDLQVGKQTEPTILWNNILRQPTWVCRQWRWPCALEVERQTLGEGDVDSRRRRDIQSPHVPGENLTAYTALSPVEKREGSWDGHK